MCINREKNYAEAGYLLNQMRKIFAYRAERRSESDRCVAGSYEDGYYDECQDEFFCLECAKKEGYEV